MSIEYDVIIIGAGAAGLMCAATAGYQGKSVLVLEHAPKAAAKIRISGGGKCNFTNLNPTPQNYICNNPHFVKSALSRYPSSTFIDLVERHGLEYEQKPLGKLFCLHRASDLIQILRTECNWAGAEVLVKQTIKAIAHVNQVYQLQTLQQTYSASKLVIATGALSYPKLKASDFGYKIAKQFHLSVTKTRPGLVPLVFTGKWQSRMSELSGLAMDVEVASATMRFKEAILFTHQGLSGPGVLQVSNYWDKGQAIYINLMPDIDVYNELVDLKQQAGSFQKWCQRFWTKRFTQAWLEWYPLANNVANLTDEELKLMAQKIQNWELYPSDTAGYDKAEVTLGGVDTDQISSKTFESKKQPGLYFIGEVLDVTGHLGGYNFQWAWSSAVACGLAMSD